MVYHGHNTALDFDIYPRRHSSVEVNFTHTSKRFLYQLVRDKTAELKRLVENYMADESVNSSDQIGIQQELLQVLSVLQVNTANSVPTNWSNVPGVTSMSTSTSNSTPTSVTNNHTNSPIYVKHSHGYVPSNEGHAVEHASAGSSFSYQPNYSYGIQPRNSNDRELITDARRHEVERVENSPHEYSHAKALTQLPSVKTLLTDEAGGTAMANDSYPQRPSYSQSSRQPSFQLCHSYRTVPLPAQVPPVPQVQQVSQTAPQAPPSLMAMQTEANLASPTHIADAKIRQFSTVDADPPLSRTVPADGIRTPLKKNQCHICGRICSRPSTLQTHLCIHTGEKPYKCPRRNCNKHFNVKSNMLRHFKKHECKAPTATVVSAAGRTQATRTDKANVLST
ncbi:unnamed protein product [Kluyveromyces dobzhanskii CBS 2104]|uniref:WGS project CCBQ000000000 data, contig 00047 n=1 Tax=Kluyveromyces dobzhanskii CBS 2104 TaxID=1427455 RepID=A0A0A8KYV5_9SACH|nr:unnamed protein product [Kluyveromyces dobzhanskii CBS 2104]